jgi:hypothetical protein
MNWTSPLPIFVWLAIVIPVTIYLWIRPPKDKLTAILAALVYTLFNLLVYWVFNWAIFYFYLRFLAIILIIAFDYHMFSQTRKKPFKPVFTPWRIAAVVLLGLALVSLGILDYKVALSFRHSGDHVLTFFPLRNGLYVITNGGNGVTGTGLNTQDNPWPGTNEEPDPAMALGFDVMEINIGGIMGNRLFPPTRQQFVGFAEQVYAPCVGPVLHVEDGLPDFDPSSKGGTKLGNYMVIQCGEYYVTLGSLRKDSIIVKEGDMLRLNMMVAQVGSSANPPLPHLHMHATAGSWKEGEGTPIPIICETNFALNNWVARNELLLRSSGN